MAEVKLVMRTEDSGREEVYIEVSTASHYLPGHDAKHRGALHHAVLAGEISEEQARAQLPTVALADQLSNGLTQARG